MSLYKHLLFASLFNASITYACEDVDYFDNDCGEVFTVETEQLQEEDSYQEINLHQEIETSARKFKIQRNKDNLKELVYALAKLQYDEFNKKVEEIADDLFSNNKELFKTYCDYENTNKTIFKDIEKLAIYNLINNKNKIPQLTRDDQGMYTVNKDHDQYLDILKSFIVQYKRNPTITKEAEQNYELYKLMCPNNADNLYDYIQKQMQYYCFYLLVKFTQSNLNQKIVDDFTMAFYNYWNALINKKQLNKKQSDVDIDVNIVKEYFKNTFWFLSDIRESDKETAIKYIAYINFGRDLIHDCLLTQHVKEFLCNNAASINDVTWHKLAEEYVSNKYTFGNNLGSASILCGIDQQNFCVDQVLRNLANAKKSNTDPRLITIDKDIEYKCAERDYFCNIKGNQITFGTAVIELNDGEKIYVTVGDTSFTTNNEFEYISKRKRKRIENIDLRDLHIDKTKFGKEVLVGNMYIKTIDEHMKNFLRSRNIEFNSINPFLMPIGKVTHIVTNGVVRIGSTYYDIDSFCNTRLKLYDAPEDQVYHKLKDILEIKGPNSGKYEVYINPKKACKINGLNFDKVKGKIQPHVSVDDVKKCLKAIVPEGKNDEEISKSPYFELVVAVWEQYWQALPKKVREVEVRTNPRYSTLYAELTGEAALKAVDLISGEDYIYGWLA